MKKIFALIAVLLLAAPAFAWNTNSEFGKIKSSAYKIFGCSITSGLDQSFGLKTTCPRVAVISGEDISIELIDAGKNYDIVYAHFKTYSNGNSNEFWRSPADQPASVGKYFIIVKSAAIVSVADKPIWGSAEFAVSTVKPWIPALPPIQQKSG